MNAAPPDRPRVGEPRFRDALRRLPGRVWIISLGILVNRLGNFLPVFIVLYLTERGYSAGAAGFVLGVSGLANVLGNLVGGHLADRIGRRWTIVLSAVPTAGLTAVVPFLRPFALIVAVVGLIGVTSQIYRPAASAVLLDSVTTNQQRLAAFAVFRFAMNIGAAVGGVLGGVLATSSYTELFLGNAAACLVFGVVVAVLLRDAPPLRSDQPQSARSSSDQLGSDRPSSDQLGSDRPGSERPGSERDDRELAADQAVGYRQALGDRVLVRFLVMTLIAEFVYIQSTVGLPLHVDGVGLTARDFGLLIGLNGLLVFVLELPTAAVVSGYRLDYCLAIGNLIIGAGLALTGFMTDLVLLAATVVLWTLGEMMTSSVANAYLGSLTPPGLVGRYQGLYFTAYTIGAGAGPLIGGALYAIAPWALWALVGIAGVLAAQLSLPKARPGQRLLRRPQSNG